ncbi:hypothetical protein ISF6_2355 [Piscinibacter sakaiensis]|uniref:Uncharacterized protein n=1 Tax=Piscinibacter sakaiensis TaxID=1547922 RepID=A0A0K8P2W6_PISS1|nr:hypothetical protein ISF6_2355 [Piscinibacter sakaiensis]
MDVSVKDGKIVCDPELAPVTAASKNLVSFRLTTPGYAFPSKGAVVLRQPSPDFPDPAVTVGPDTVTLRDLNQTKGVYAYTVKVVSAGGEELQHDPGIGNDGGGP